MSGDALNAPAGTMNLTDELNVNPAPAPRQRSKRKRSQAGSPAPNSEVVALSPETLLAPYRFVCEICNKGFHRDQNLQLHLRGHNLPWKLSQRAPEMEGRKRVYVCPEPTCVHHHPSRALGDLTGIRKHYSRKHCEKNWKCDKCFKRYAILSDMKTHQKTCGTQKYKCNCGDVFTKKRSLAAHQSYCDALTQESIRTRLSPSAVGSDQSVEPDEAAAVYNNVNLSTQDTNRMFEAMMTLDYGYEEPPQDLNAALGMGAYGPNDMADTSTGIAQSLHLGSTYSGIGSSSSFLDQEGGFSMPNPMQMPGTSLSLLNMPLTEGKGKEVAAPLLTPQYNTNQQHYQQSTSSTAELPTTALLEKATLGLTASNLAVSSLLTGLMSSLTTSNPMGSSSFSGLMNPSSIAYDQVERDIEFELFGTRRPRTFKELLMGPYPGLEMRAGGENNEGTMMEGSRYNCNQPIQPQPVQQPAPAPPSYPNQYFLSPGAGRGGQQDFLDPPN